MQVLRRHLLGAPLIGGRRTPLNVLWIFADDLNDWIGCLGGHPQVQTPSLDALARRGVLFTNAHCAAPLCNPSRTSAMLGRNPTSTGVYDNAPSFRTAPSLRDSITLSQFLRQNDYRTMGAGKVFHGPQLDEPSFEFRGPTPGAGPKLSSKANFEGGHALWDWGSPYAEQEYGDTITSDWGIDQLRQPDRTPFFLGLGLHTPHAPWYAPSRFFDRYPLETLQTAPVRPGDGRRISPQARNLTFGWPSPRHEWMERDNLARITTRAYLAAVSYADWVVGRVLEALEQSSYRENTAVVFAGDNGFHLGEKERWGKQSLWQRSTRVPLIVSMPGGVVGARCPQPVSLVDLFPTIVEAAGLPAPEGLDGQSLWANLRDPSTSRVRPALTTYLPGNHSLCDENFRYIRYSDGSHELYDHRSDPNEWFDLSANPQFAHDIARLSQWLPRRGAPPVPGSADPARFPVPVLRPKVPLC